MCEHECKECLHCREMHSVFESRLLESQFEKGASE